MLLCRLGPAAVTETAILRRTYFHYVHSTISNTLLVPNQLSSSSRKGMYYSKRSIIVGKMLNSGHRSYLVSQPIVAWYQTAMIGDARKPPTLIAAANFNGMAVIGT